ncbi:hypothetical protein AB5J62_38685 [Amycolatopsis sp. cg5]|uniref:hypothetical protein n=1 Tax=Amycolatopsis sp. cg5 TaxID=3238802 RepID=UPI0035249D79
MYAGEFEIHLTVSEAGAAESVLAWNVDWPNFVDEYPSITGGAEQWQHRLAPALRSSFG